MSNPATLVAPFTADLSGSSRGGPVAFGVASGTPAVACAPWAIWGEAGVKGSGTDHVRWGRDASKHPFVEWSSNNAAYQRLTASETVDAGVEHLCYIGWDSTGQQLSIDAGALQTGSRAAVSGSFGSGPLTLKAE